MRIWHIRKRKQHTKAGKLGGTRTFSELGEVRCKCSMGYILGPWQPKLENDHQKCIMQYDVYNALLEYDGEITKEFLTLW